MRPTGLFRRRHARMAARHGSDCQDLAERLQRDGKLEIDEAVALARQIAAALEVAHEAGVVHRDRKPANIRVTELADGPGRPRRGRSTRGGSHPG